VIAILVTRPEGPSDTLVQALRQRGYRVHAVPTMQTEPVDFNPELLADCDWIVLTSVRGVQSIRALPSGPRYAVVGPETAKALRARGIEPAHMPSRADGADLGETLPDVEGKRISLVRASAAATDLPDRLRQRGATVREVTAYRTVEAPATSAEPLRMALADPELAAVVFASGSAVRGFIQLARPHPALGADLPSKWGGVALAAITIGPHTSASAREHGFRVIAEADTQSVSGLVGAIVRVLPLEVQNNA
jgi:uroporphyrinogen III methyltransferase/synthase